MFVRAQLTTVLLPLILSVLACTGEDAPPTPAANLTPVETVAVSDALRGGLFTVVARGDNLERVTLRITSEAAEPAVVRIPAGTLLKPADREVQTMVVRETHDIAVGAGGAASATLAVACMEMNQSVPNADDAFSIESIPDEATIRRELQRGLDEAFAGDGEVDPETGERVDGLRPLPPDLLDDLRSELTPDELALIEGHVPESLVQLVLREYRDLQRLLEHATLTDSPFRVQQFAIWTIMANPERQGFVGITGSSLRADTPSGEELAAVRDLLVAAGIDATPYVAMAPALH